MSRAPAQRNSHILMNTKGLSQVGGNISPLVARGVHLLPFYNFLQLFAMS